jgi:hypothetical protein
MPMRFLAVVLAAAALGSLGPATVVAHHSGASQYRTDEQTTIDGVLVSLVYRSPHSYLHVNAPDRGNHMRVWAVECGDSRQLRQQVADGSLRPGDHVIVTGDPSRDDGDWRLRLRTLVRPSDGWRWRETPR